MVYFTTEMPSRLVGTSMHRRFALGMMLACSLSFAGGCSESSKPKAAAHTDEHHGGHAHAEEGPHHGQLIELGKEEYHAEMIHDDAAHKVTIYLLDGAAKESVAIADRELTLNVVAGGKPLQFKLPAVPQATDPSGQSSRFELTDETLCEGLDDPKTTGRLNVTIGGKPFAGDVHHGEHHDHK